MEATDRADAKSQGVISQSDLPHGAATPHIKSSLHQQVKHSTTQVILSQMQILPLACCYSMY